MRTDIDRTNIVITEYKHRLLIMQLWREGHPIEFRKKADPREIWYTPKDPDFQPMWDWEDADYRIKRT